jgi:glycosyltransferase involved in cell wall biosynthesis
MEYMSICNIFSLHSYQETLGLVYLEAMAHGKAVIGCVGQGVDGIIIDGETGLLTKPRDEKGLLCAVDLLLANHDKANEIGQRARKLVLKNYTWEGNARR